MVLSNIHARTQYIPQLECNQYLNVFGEYPVLSGSALYADRLSGSLSILIKSLIPIKLETGVSERHCLNVCKSNIKSLSVTKCIDLKISPLHDGSSIHESCILLKCYFHLYWSGKIIDFLVQFLCGLMLTRLDNDKDIVPYILQMIYMAWNFRL